MTETKSLFKVAGIFGAAALTLSLASCSGGQSVADACNIANSTVNEATGDLQSVLSDATSGEGDLSAAFDPITEALEDAQSEVTNEEVSTALASFTDELSAMSGTLEGYEIPDASSIDPADPEAMDKLDQMQAEAEEMTTKLQEQSTSLTEAGQNLQDICTAG
ncbi:hypothetical protein [Leucobacter sp. NPDC077196]|uniref:hypothetical protein n=1 Tax=Leucobacter sp. NPDC077196 TaxID=3154959 RepID=UPI00343A07FB